MELSEDTRFMGESKSFLLTEIAVTRQSSASHIRIISVKLGQTGWEGLPLSESYRKKSSCHGWPTS